MKRKNLNFICCVFISGFLLSFFLSVSQPLSKSDIVYEDVTQLRKFLEIPYEPLQVRWRFETRGDGYLGPQDHTMTALILYPADTAQTLASHVSSKGYLVETINPETWEHKVLIKWNDAHSDVPYSLKGTYLPENLFSKSPFLNGEVILIQGTSIVFARFYTQ